MSNSDDSDIEYNRRKSFKDNLRKMIMHENDLTNHRINWLYAIQGFLFLALGTILNGLFNFKASKNISPTDLRFNPILGDAGNVIFGVVVSGIILCFIGFSVAHSSQKGILGSTKAIKRLVEIAHRKERNTCRRYSNDFCEPIIGGCSYDKEKKHVLRWDKILETDNNTETVSKGLKKILKGGRDWIWVKIFKTDNTGTDSKRLKKILKENYGLNWIDDNATIKKSDHPLNITVSSNDGNNALSIVLNEELNDKELNLEKKGDKLIVYEKEKSPIGFTPFFPWITLPIIFMYAWVAIALYFVYIPISYFFVDRFPPLAWLSHSTSLKIVLVSILILIAVRFVIIVHYAEDNSNYRKP